MQTTTLPIQPNAAQAAAPRHGNPASGDGAQFSAMLSNELTLRQPAPAPSAPAPAAPKTQAPRPQAASKPVQPDDAAQAAQAAPAEGAKTADAGEATDADKAEGQDPEAEAHAGQAGDPASAMLALMASLQPAQATAPQVDAAAGGAASQAFDALNGAGGKGKRADAAQLSALQAAMKPAPKESAGIATTAAIKAGEGADLRNPALAAGDAVGTDGKPMPAAGLETANKPAAELRAALAAARDQAETRLDSAELALRQARESAAREPAGAAAALAQVQAQPAVLEAAQLAAGAERLSARVGSDAWGQQVGQKLVYMVGTEEQTASLTLNPPDLGPLQVVLSVSNDQASVSFSANQEEVRQALENALPRLREMMSESGITLGSATVNAGMADGRQAREQAAQHGAGNGGNASRGGTVNVAGETTARPARRTAILGEHGMVDTFA